MIAAREIFHPVLYPLSFAPTLPHPLTPFLKWAGGKRDLVPKLTELYEPHRHRRFVDLTNGSGAIALGVRPQNALLNDVNPHLINLFQQIQQGFDLEGFEPVNTPEGYLRRRERFNSLVRSGECSGKEPAQLFYYLLKHCFNGLCRFNSKGLFNVGWGKYKSVSLISDWSEYQEAIAPWTFTCGDFSSVSLEQGDFVIVDPPYDSETDGQLPLLAEFDSTGSGFVGYSGVFSWSDQVRLTQLLDTHPGPVVAFNLATDRIINLYESLGFEIEVYDERRAISCDGDRTPVKAVLMTRSVLGGNSSTTALPRIESQTHSLEQTANNSEVLHDSLARLEQEREQIKDLGVAPDGAWIESGKVQGRDFRQVYWRASTAIFESSRGSNPEGRVSRKYIGKEGSPEHQSAIALRDRRNRLKQVEEQIQILNEQMEAIDESVNS